MIQTGCQQTLASTASIEGIGLHTGQQAHLTMRAAAVGVGIIFIRTDLPGAPELKVQPHAVNGNALMRRTELAGPDGTMVITVEHLLAACQGLGLDNARIELDGPEVPILDGSAQPFAEAILNAGLVKQDAPRAYLQLNRPVSFITDDAEIMAIPAERMHVAFFADLARAGMSNQAATFTLWEDDFAKALAPARTFVFYEDVEKLKIAGLIRGGSLDCAIVLKDGEPYNTEYRLPNELARHKLLDLLGDLAILGRPIGAFITARATGHALHYAFVAKLVEELKHEH